MSDWMRTKVRLKNTTEIIIKYLPKITIALEEVAKNQNLKKIFYTEIKDTKMSYVLTEEIAKMGKKLTEVEK